MILNVGYQNKTGTKSLRIKTGTVINLMIALLLLGTLEVSAYGYAQKVTIVKKNILLTDAFKAIEQQTGFLFFYDKDLIQKAAPIDISLKNATLEQALAMCLKDQQLTYTIVKNTIVIQEKKVHTTALYRQRRTGN